MEVEVESSETLLIVQAHHFLAERGETVGEFHLCEELGEGDLGKARSREASQQILEADLRHCSCQQ